MWVDWENSQVPSSAWNAVDILHETANISLMVAHVQVLAASIACLQSVRGLFAHLSLVYTVQTLTPS